eukprot:Tbor_TRINITY_DN10142_c0_g1::TRINITY_DN10142_c0_g1_i1::g.17233::m.17233
MRSLVIRKCVISHRAISSIIGSELRFSCVNIQFAMQHSLTKALNRIKEESQGQYLDLIDMNEASRNAANSLQEIVKRNPVEDPNLKNKITNLVLTMKAYHTRLNNLQNEALSLQGETDGALKLVCGENMLKSTSSTVDSDAYKNSDIDVSVTSIKSEEIQTSTPLNQEVETVEGEIIKDDIGDKYRKKTEASKASEEYIEVEIEPTEPDGLPSIPEIIKALHEGAVDFSDCRDANSLRHKYQDFLDGKFKQSSNAYKPQEPQKQPPKPKPPQSSYAGSSTASYRPPTPNSHETSLASDPFPNGERRMLDPMLFVYQVKADIAKSKGMQPENIDLWSGSTRLNDHKRLYDYPTIQQFPIEVRNKGDFPSGR